jgi:hypothetical protein
MRHASCTTVTDITSLIAEQANSSVVGQPFSKLVASSGGTQQQPPGSLETKLKRDFQSTAVGVKHAAFVFCFGGIFCFMLILPNNSKKAKRILIKLCMEISATGS